MARLETIKDKWILRVMCWSDYGAMQLMKKQKEGSRDGKNKTN
jgi:hypothetical protein